MIIGGGINGTGIAVEAAKQGLTVALCDMDDLGSHTSSASSKLIHGGLRYLEQKAFKLVRESLTEREILLNQAPHLIHPIRFLMPQNPSSRPTWLIRLGLFLYDHLGKKSSLPHCERILFKKQPNNPLKPHLETGFTYFDCQVDDARLVIANALQAEALGATLLTQTKCLQVRHEADLWRITCDHRTIQAKALVNATGPWTESFLTEQCQKRSPLQIRLVKGSHIVFPKLYEGSDAYILQNKDGRVVFVIPFEKDFTMIGTTDVPYEGNPAKVCIDEAEKHYLCDVYNDYFVQSIHPAQIIYHWSGVRPLYDDHTANPAEVTRDYKLDLQVTEGNPLLSVFGGKITTYRHLATQAFDLLKPFFSSIKKYDTHSESLPGGMIPYQDCSFFMKIIQAQYPLLPQSLLERYIKLYGSRLFMILDNKQSLPELGDHYGYDLYEAEVQYLKKHEWAHTTEDILWRRTKLGLYFSAAEQNILEQKL